MDCGGLDVTYGDLEDELGAVVGGLKGVQNWGELGGVELDCRGGQRRVLVCSGALVELQVAVDIPSTTAPMTC